MDAKECFHRLAELFKWNEYQ